MSFRIETEIPCLTDPSKGICPEGCKLREFALRKWLDLALDQSVNPDVYTLIVTQDAELLDEHRRMIQRSLGMTGQNSQCTNHSTSK